MSTKNKPQKSSMNMLRKMSIVPVVFIALYLFACNSEGRRDSATEMSQPLSESVWQKSWTPQNDMEESVIVVAFLKEDINNDVIVTHDSKRRIARGVISYNEVEQKPVFQGKDNDFRRYLGQNIRYPADAHDNGIAGTVVVSFVVDKDGKVTDVRSPVKIDILSEEVERVIKSSPAWKPGKKGGKDVAVQCYTFVEFRLASATPTSSAEADEETVIFAHVEVKPLFDGKDVEKAFREWVSKNTVYPAAAQENGIQGRVYVEFTIDKDGSIINVRLLGGSDPLLDAEALRVISSSPKWTPGKHGGKVVRVKYTFPFVFKLNN